MSIQVIFCRYTDDEKQVEAENDESIFVEDVVGNFDINICKIVLDVRTRTMSYPTNPDGEEFLRRGCFYVNADLLVL